MEVYRQWVPCKCNSIYNFAHLFFHSLKICMWFGFNPAVNFCHFLLTFSVFNFSQVRHQLYRSSICTIGKKYCDSGLFSPLLGKSIVKEYCSICLVTAFISEESGMKMSAVVAAAEQ